MLPPARPPEGPVPEVELQRLECWLARAAGDLARGLNGACPCRSEPRDGFRIELIAHVARRAAALRRALATS